VVEADEFDRSFLQLFPEMAVITSMDPDHLDIYGAAEHMAEAYNDFAAQLKPGGLLVYKHGMPLRLPVGVTAVSYGTGGQVHAQNVRVEDHKYHFDYVGATVIDNIVCGLPGIHNVENAVAAITIALAQGVAVEHIREGVASFKGVKRRFEYCIDREDCVYIDDYAHHPTEIDALLASVKQLYPGKKVLGIFQPHLFSRTRDFAAAFAKSLSQLDELLLLDIYPARELPLPGITSAWLLEQVTAPAKTLVQKAELLDVIAKKQYDVLLTIGAGDIDRFVRPITELLQHKSPVR
jgi:UDP-N-acetylmuramate--alanine ligase